MLDGITVTRGNASGTTGTNESFGGGLYANGSSPTLNNCTFIGNSASNDGGGIYSYSSSLTLTNCSFSGNSANYSGGGMYDTSSSPTLSNCSFSGNSANYSGGGMYDTSSSPTLSNCTFSGNIATIHGGGMYNFSSSSPTLTNCTFSGNAASDSGGGMHNSTSSSPTLTNCTFSGNAASVSGGGMYNFSSSPTLTNCILWGNTANTSPQIHQSYGGTTTITYSDIQGGYTGVGNIDADPLFVRTPWTGPDGMFGTADDDPGDLRLRAGSPAVDVGSNAAVSGITTDLGGNARIQNSTVDMGAYEGAVAAPALKTLYVDGSAGGANTGTSWTDAFTSLQSALRAAGDGDTIRIADGTYTPTSTTDRNVGFALRNGMAVYGGYAGYGAADPDVRDIAHYPTILSGDIGATASNADNSYHVLTATGVDPSTVLDGVTVTGGNANGSLSDQSLGGGLYTIGASATLANCTFSGNSASRSGGGIYNTVSSLTLNNCTFSGNSANYSGGGIYSTVSSLTLLNCTFRGNAARNEGGGMCNTSSSPTLVNCTFSGNSGIAGGGMYNTTSSSPTLVNCTFSGNSGIAGGGMYNTTSSSPTLTNCTFSGNGADYGGGIYNFSSSPTLTNCIVWENAASTSPQIHQSGGTMTITYSDIQGGYTGVGNIDADPLFVRTPWTGPDGLFGTADDDHGDLGLREGSPGLDIGSNAAVSGISTDVAGNARIQNGTVDLGAFEGPAVLPGPKVLYVDHAATSGTNTGGSWTDAFTSLQSALRAAGAGDTIRIADGTYRPTNTTDHTLSFALRDGVAIRGGYAGYGASDPDARDITRYPTILSGNIGSASSRTDNSSHVLTAIGVDPSTLLDGVTVTGGWAYGNGGGLLATRSSTTLINCTFSGNWAWYGGAIYNDDSSSPTLINCIFSENSASNHGGGMHSGRASSPTLINCTFGGNFAYNKGGGMYNGYASSPLLINCTFNGNTAGGAFGYGGGLFDHSSSPMLVNCTFSGNVASISGGGMYTASSASKLTSCILWGNTAANGPQIYQSGDTVTVTYSNIQGGYAGVGNIDADPLFVRNPSPGPDGFWNGIDDDYGDLRLQPTSPCVDAGNNAAPGLAGIATDLAGKPRFVDIALTPDTGAGTAPIVDIGAYETQWRAPAWLDPAGAAVWNASTYSLDIGSQTLVVAADDSNRTARLGTIRQAIAIGRGVEAGIVSTAAGQGQAVIATLDPAGSILIHLALLGDVTLDDRLDGDDYFALDRAFLAASGHEPEADLDLNGIIDGRDYFMLDARFLGSVAGTVAAALPTDQIAQPPAGPFSTRSIADELLLDEDSILTTAE